MLDQVAAEEDISNRRSFAAVSSEVSEGSQTQYRLAWRKLKNSRRSKARIPNFVFLTMEGKDYHIIWLHGNSDDVLIPLSDGYRKWEAYKPHSEIEIFRIMKSELEGRLKH